MNATRLYILDDRSCHSRPAWVIPGTKNVGAASAREGFFTSTLSQDMESLVPYRLAGPDFHLEVLGDQSQGYWT